MHYKTRTKSNELVTLEILNKRMNLSRNDKQYYLSLKKGYEGEMLFDSFTKNLQNKCLILNDLLLTVNHTTFQIDSLIIAHGKIYIYEVKNYSGDYYYEADKLFKKPQIEIINPLHQLGRNEAILQRLLFDLGFSLPINAFVVFINPSFTMYQAPFDNRFIFPTQIRNYLNDFNIKSAQITEKHVKLADELISLHQTDSLYKQIPTFNYKQLQKGITCSKCHSFAISVEQTTYVCQKCSHSEKISNAVIRCIEEFRILFPHKRLTTSIIHDWCREVSQPRIRRILLKNFKKVGSHRWSYYV